MHRLLTIVIMLGIGAVAAAEPPAPRIKPPNAAPTWVPAGDSAAFHDLWFGPSITPDLRIRRAESELRDSISRDLVIWRALRRADPDRHWRAMAQFSARRPAWPWAQTYRARAERAAPDDLSLQAWRALFGTVEPLTGAGAVHVARALQDESDDGVRRAFAERTWIRDIFTANEEAAFLDVSGDVLTPALHEARVDRLLWSGSRRPAWRQLRRVDGEAENAGRLRYAFLVGEGAAEARFRAASATIQDAPGVRFERARRLRRRGLDAEAARNFEAAAQALDAAPPAAKRWARERQIAARRLIADGDWAQAYEAVRTRRLQNGAPFAEISFLAGYIALNGPTDPQAALEHFDALAAGVTFPISVARAAYWRGLALEAMQDKKAAEAAFAHAAVHHDTFYGALAMDRIDGGRPSKSSAPVTADGDSTADEVGDLARAAAILAELGADEALIFASRAANAGLSPNVAAWIADTARSHGRPEVAVRLAKILRREGATLPAHAFPRPPLVLDGVRSALSDPVLALAVARQESEFNVDAVSPAGARGLMQFMPRTGRLAAKEAGARYRRSRLAGDPAYAARLGGAHLAGLTDRFDGSYVLAIAAYNAGPVAASRWVRAHGDPRTTAIEPVDWIERVPFSETRSYIQRVFENILAYRAALEPSAYRSMSHELRRGRHAPEAQADR